MEKYRRFLQREYSKRAIFTDEKWGSQTFNHSFFYYYFFLFTNAWVVKVLYLFNLVSTEIFEKKLYEWKMFEHSTVCACVDTKELWLGFHLWIQYKKEKAKQVASGYGSSLSVKVIPCCTSFLRNLNVFGTGESKNIYISLSRGG